MDVSNQNESGEPGGQQLIEQVVSLTGLPESMVEKEIHEILDLSGRDAANVTLDELRQAMLLYLEEIAKSHEDSSLRAAEGSLIS